MKNNVKMTIGNAETVKEIEEYMQKIHDRYDCYVEFQYSCSISLLSEGDSYEKWAILTPFTKANKTFGSECGLLAFMKRIAEDEDGWVLNHYKKILAEEKRSLEEDKKSIDRALKTVKTTLVRLNEM